RRDRVDVAVEPPLALGGRDADGPMAGAAHIRLAPTLKTLHGADLVAFVVVRPASRLDQFLKNVVEAFVLEVALLLRHPFLQAEMRLDDEFVLGHGTSSGFAVIAWARWSELSR